MERSFFPGVSPRGGSTPRLLTFRPLACWSRRWGEGFRRWVQRGDPSTMSPPLPDSPTPELGMSDHLNPQRDQMADESMVRTLAAQAAAIWPQEQHLVARYDLPRGSRVLDAGCGTGEWASRVAAQWPGATVRGIDVIDEPLAVARVRHAALAPRLSFAQGSIFELADADGTYDLVGCRHVLQSIPHADRAVAELSRVLKPGGWLHLIAEDYGMLHFGAEDPLVTAFFHEGPLQFGASTGTDMHIGRHAAPLLAGLGYEKVSVEYVVVDTLRVPRETMAAIFTAWRDGYASAAAKRTRFSEAEAVRAFDGAIACVRDPGRYSVWHVPVVAGRKRG